MSDKKLSWDLFSKSDTNIYSENTNKYINSNAKIHYYVFYILFILISLIALTLSVINFIDNDNFSVYEQNVIEISKGVNVTESSGLYTAQTDVFVATTYTTRLSSNNLTNSVEEGVATMTGGTITSDIMEANTISTTGLTIPNLKIGTTTNNYNLIFPVDAPTAGQTLTAGSITPTILEWSGSGSGPSESITGGAFVDSLKIKGGIGDQGVTLESSDTSTNYTVKLPANPPTSGQFLKASGVDELTWGIPLSLPATSVGALDSGSITSGFSNIDNGTNSIKTTSITLADGATGVTINSDSSSNYNIELPTSAPTAGSLLSVTSGDISKLEWTTPSGGGNVSGPVSSIDNGIVTYDGTTGTQLKGTNVTIFADAISG
jgi:hypothetical protein